MPAPSTFKESALAMSAGTVPGMLEWIPISSGGAFAPIVSVI